MASLLRFHCVREIVGDVVRVHAPADAQAHADVRFGDLAWIEADSAAALAQVSRIDGDVVTLQVFGGTKGMSTRSSVRFLGRSMRVAASRAVLGRVFRGTGEPLDGGPSLADAPSTAIAGPSVNPVRRRLASRMVRTDVPMIDVFNTLVESQKIPIFSVAGEPYDALLARIGVQSDADVVVFGGLGLVFDDYHTFVQRFQAAGVFARTVMFVNLASDPVLERLLVPDLALAVAEHFAVEERLRVLVLLTDMTAYADALKEVGIGMDMVPSNRGYMGDLYSQLARRYERACDHQDGGSVTILSVTTMPGGDVTHPVPDNTGYITEGQFYLHDGLLDPFGSLSRLKQHVIGKVTREDHGAVMNAMIRLYAVAVEAEQKQAMAFELGDFDRRALGFGREFRRRFMALDVSLPLEQALDLGWRTMAEFFTPDEVLVKQAWIDKYWPQPTTEPVR